MSELDELLKEELREEVANEPAESTEPDEAPAQETKGEEEGSPPEPEQQEATQQPEEDPQADYLKQVEGLKAALAAERQKRQHLESQQQEQQRPDFWENPEAVIQDLEARTEQKIQRARIDWSENAARARYEDFDQKLDVFSKMVEEGTASWQQIVNSPDPAEQLYQSANRYQQLQEFGNAESYKQSLEAKIRKEVEAEMEKKLEEMAKQRESLPGSVTEARASSGSKKSDGDTLDSILGR